MVTQISAQRSSKGEGGRGGRGNPPSRGAQVGFEQINQGRRRGGEDILSPALTCCAIPFPPYWLQAQQRDPALSPIEDVSPSLEMEAEQDSMNRLQVGSMIHQKAPISTAWRHSLRDIRSMILVKNRIRGRTLFLILTITNLLSWLSILEPSPYKKDPSFRIISNLGPKL